MLSREDNERLVRVGKGTPLASSSPLLDSFPAVGGPRPKTGNQAHPAAREDLVAFRDSRAASAWSIRPVRIAVLR